MKITFSYFDFPFWRAEASRLALHLGRIDFVDHRPGKEEFMRLKASGELPYGQLPVLEVDGVRYAQSVAIARFCGQLAGLYPQDDPIAALRVDELLEAINEINYQLIPSMREKDVERKLAMRASFAEATLPEWLGRIEARLMNNETQTFIVGNRMTVADLALWRAVEWLTSGILDGVPTDLLDPHPALKAHVQGIAALPEVSAWMTEHYG